MENSDQKKVKKISRKKVLTSLSLTLFIVMILGMALFLGGIGYFLLKSGGVDKRELLAQLEKGVSTRNEVKSILGEPDRIEVKENGEEVWQYINKVERTTRAVQDPYEYYIIEIVFTKSGIVKEALTWNYHPAKRFPERG